MIKYNYAKTFSLIALAVSFFIAPDFSQAKGNGIFLVLRAKSKTKNSDVTLKGRTGKDTSISIFVNGEDIGDIILDEQNRYHVRVPLGIGNNSVRVTARSEGLEKTLEKNIKRKANTAYEKPLWISIAHTKNRIKKPDVTVRGKAHGVSEVQISVDGIFQGAAEVSAMTGEFKFRASLASGVNIIEARADNGSENVIATKRVRRL
ncbi:MAG: hypothetical protein UX02_C0002G0015 [Candidatus Moranbacteria bacterium GW2011_GWC1_45_18]|nr:MAG: hypothetical protein UT79_C0001G0446 [Candidatus Moranbacteria bacterium GW2011_GWC2_40_12]KKT32540.1 MAG: hypothetical protein UW19_C0019G0024 [Candidatus Moranbacteria bacterium GW2011_GWF2_44_10]KKT72144.1 MAG: hypothetical protein UW66_C0012G0003 [Candidatus Moranbacteria bacterium GW2011_GWF1_44_4]KKT99696.1 MAG: hypothetical protein UX02_C0002G0015 [Candidatus Moranbacteria bacterium GW2011_GWC1_45_18]OGI35268.1 MAG: hypothetical protein A2407_01270 [Candidatus Moranbacteria bacte